MKIQIATTKEQSQRIIACGVNPDSADMCYVGGWSEVCAIPFSKCNKEDTPAWSLSALLALIPKNLMWQGLYYRFVMGPNENGWDIEYNDLSVINNLHRVTADSLIEAVVQMIEWLTQNGYNLNKP